MKLLKMLILFGVTSTIFSSSSDAIVFKIQSDINTHNKYADNKGWKNCPQEKMKEYMDNTKFSSIKLKFENMMQKYIEGDISLINKDITEISIPDDFGEIISVTCSINDQKDIWLIDLRDIDTDIVNLRFHLHYVFGRN